MDLALELLGLTKTFANTVALDKLDLSVARGTMCGLIGPSGSGKTTTIRLIMSILFPDSGTLQVLGKASALQAKDGIGYLPEERGAYRRMTVSGFLSYIGRLKGGARAEVQTRASDLLARLGLADAGGKRCQDLSKGMLQRVQFVAAIINQPDLLILDEPFSGLDPMSVRLLKELIAQEHKRGATILFSTHVMTHAEELCDRIVMLHQGRKVLDAPMSGLRRQYDRRRILFEPLQDSLDPDWLMSVPGVEQVERTGEAYEVRLAAGSDPGEAMRAITSRVAPARMELARIRLEDVFIQLVTGADGRNDSVRALRTHLRGHEEGVAA
jgi:ABC-2 type transport system ATP-binding protein